MPLILALAAGLGLVLFMKRAPAGGTGPGACPISNETMRTIMAPVLLPSLDPTAPKPTAAAVANARALVQRLEGCGQKADADLFRAGIFAVTKDPKDAPVGVPVK